jgi:hypothetical protein
MKTYLLLIALVSSTLMASEEYSIEERFKSPVKIPAAISSHLNKEIGKDISYCEDKQPDSRYEAKIVNLSSSLRAYLVKPTNFCLCGAYYCPVWLFTMKDAQPSLIWSTSATGNLAILPKKTNGYYQLKEFGGTTGHGHRSIWAWDGKKYKEFYRQSYMMNGSKGCADVETFHLKGKKLISVSNECLKELPEP